MNRSSLVSSGLLLLVLSSGLSTPPTAAELFESGGFHLFADFRTRFEADFDSQRADGSEREDRTRVRIRARLGLEYESSDHLRFGLRLRTGSDLSHQSPHITVLDLDDNDTGDADLNLDRWYLEGHWSQGSLWVGRTTFPLWRQSELLWDDDATVAGLGGSYLVTAGKGSLALHGGWFSLPVGMRELSGQAGSLQLVYRSGTPSFTGALGIVDIDANPSDPDAGDLLSGNGLRDYRIWIASLQLGLAAGELPVVLGADLLHNDEDYSPDDPDPATAAHHDQTDGLVLSVRIGNLSGKGDWRASYTYAEIETLAVDASYAQDDWVRWGSATETRGSNFEGSELRLDYGLLDNLNLVARLYLVESITTEEDGKRFRLDFNFGL